MSIDERLEKLAERHETLSQTLELLTRDIAELRESTRTLWEVARQDGENIRALARIAETRERRTDREGGT